MLPIDTLLGLVIFAFVTSITPGPNNLMLLSSGVNFGFWRTMPHMIGVSGGFMILALCVGLGLGTVLTAFPAFHLLLKILGGAYLLYLAWQIAKSDTLQQGAVGKTPMSLKAAALFQWVNPKAWMMAITSMALYTQTDKAYSSMLVVAVVFTLVNLPCIMSWIGFGTAMRGFLSDPARLRWFNRIMGLFLALTIIPMVQ